MRKTFFAIFVIAGVAIMFGKLSNRNKLVNTLFLENVEALASGEGGAARCRGTGNILCPQIGIRVAYTLEPFNLE